MIETILALSGIFAIMALILYLRYKLSHWEDVVSVYRSEVRYDLNPIHGFWSEYQRSPDSFPLSNHFLKAAPTKYGLYLQYDLSFEPKIYKPVFIPWGNIIIKSSEKGSQKGGVEYLILNNKFELGSIYIQFPISDQLIEMVQALGANLTVLK